MIRRCVPLCEADLVVWMTRLELVSQGAGDVAVGALLIPLVRLVGAQKRLSGHVRIQRDVHKEYGSRRALLRNSNHAIHYLNNCE